MYLVFDYQCLNIGLGQGGQLETFVSQQIFGVLPQALLKLAIGCGRLWFRDSTIIIIGTLFYVATKSAVYRSCSTLFYGFVSNESHHWLKEGRKGMFPQRRGYDARMQGNRGNTITGILI